MLFFGGFTHLFLPYFFPVLIEAEHFLIDAAIRGGYSINISMVYINYYR